MATWCDDHKKWSSDDCTLCKQESAMVKLALEGKLLSEQELRMLKTTVDYFVRHQGGGIRSSVPPERMPHTQRQAFTLLYDKLEAFRKAVATYGPTENS